MEIIIYIAVIALGVILGCFTAIWFQIVCLALGLFIWRRGSKNDDHGIFFVIWMYLLAALVLGILAGNGIYYAGNIWPIIADIAGSIWKAIIYIPSKILSFVLR